MTLVGLRSSVDNALETARIAAARRRRDDHREDIANDHEPANIKGTAHQIRPAA